MIQNLNLRRRIKSAHKAFLDLGFKTRDQRFSISLYEKQDGFTNFIVRMHHLLSNVRSKILHFAFRAEFLRIARTTRNCN